MKWKAVLSVAVVALLMGAITAPAVYSGSNDVDLCHQTGNGFIQISVDESSVPAHLAHGDFKLEAGATCDQQVEEPRG